MADDIPLSQLTYLCNQELIALSWTELHENDVA